MSIHASSSRRLLFGIVIATVIRFGHEAFDRAESLTIRAGRRYREAKSAVVHHGDVARPHPPWLRYHPLPGRIRAGPVVRGDPPTMKGDGPAGGGSAGQISS
jgi:hypothetical protein